MRPIASDSSGQASTGTRPSGRGRPASGRIGHYLVSRWRLLRYIWRRDVIRGVDHQRVADRLAEDEAWSPRYLFMIMMSCGIAILGLLLSSPAVIIGAMLISPLMGPIMGFGFSLATLDYGGMRRSAWALFLGSSLAVAIAALVVLLSPLTAVTTEILARTRPNFFDLLVAVFSALAGAYAVIRGRGETIVGVAIATALMPPLATVGFGLATWNMTILGGAVGLFMTNLLAIALTGTMMAKIYGFGTAVSPRSTRMQDMIIICVFIAMSIPLGFSLRQIAWETITAGKVKSVLDGYFGAESRISDVKLDFALSDGVGIEAVVLTRSYRPTADRDLTRALTGVVGKPVSFDIDQVIVGQDESLKERQRLALEEATQSVAKMRAREEAREREATLLADLLTLVTSARPDDVVIDPSHKHAFVQATPQSGLDLAALRLLEARLGARYEGWRIEISPPQTSLPIISFAPGSAQLSPEGLATVDTIAWAAIRWGNQGLALVGRTAASNDAPRRRDMEPLARARAEAVAEALKARGVSVVDVLVDPVGPRQRSAEALRGSLSFRSVEVLPAVRGGTLLSPAP